jgi:hypothetical protein
VVYSGNVKPLFTTGQQDIGNGLSKIAQEGNQSELVASLGKAAGVKHVYVLDPSTHPITPGNSAEIKIEAAAGDKIAFATMFGNSNDWFYAFDDTGVPITQTGDLSSYVKLWDDGTEINEYPGAGNHEAAFNPGLQNPESKAIGEVDTALYPTLPAVKNVIKVTLSK